MTETSNKMRQNRLSKIFNYVGNKDKKTELFKIFWGL